MLISLIKVSMIKAIYYRDEKLSGYTIKNAFQGFGKNTLYIKSGGEIPRRSVDPGFSASPKSTINAALLFYILIPKSQCKFKSCLLKFFTEKRQRR